MASSHWSEHEYTRRGAGFGCKGPERLVSGSRRVGQRRCDLYDMEQQLGWARRWVAARPDDVGELRQGAWYPVVSRSGTRMVLEVSGRRLEVPQDALELRPKRPDRFTVVYRTRDDPNPTRGTAADLGPRYAVCPRCSTRRWLGGSPANTKCKQCGHEGVIAWWETG